MYSAVWIIFFPQLVQITELFGKFDPELQHMISVTVEAGAGLSLFLLRVFTQKSIINHNALPKDRRKKYLLAQIEAFDLLILTVIPGSEAFAFLLKTHYAYSLALIPYVITSSGWFVLIAILHEKFEDSKAEKNFWIYQSLWVIVLFIFAIFAFWMLNTYSQIVQQAAQHVSSG